MARELRPPMPVTQKDSVNMTLRHEALAVLDDNGRYMIRELVARAYADGFQEGRINQMSDDNTDRSIERDKAVPR